VYCIVRLNWHFKLGISEMKSKRALLFSHLSYVQKYGAHMYSRNIWVHLVSMHFRSAVFTCHIYLNNAFVFNSLHCIFCKWDNLLFFYDVTFLIFNLSFSDDWCPCPQKVYSSARSTFRCEGEAGRLAEDMSGKTNLSLRLHIQQEHTNANFHKTLISTSLLLC